MINKRISIVTDINAFEERCDEVLGDTSFDYVKDVVARLKDALYANKDAPALCAPQIGEHTRIFVVRNGQKDQERFKIFLNPIVVSSKELHMSREANISFPNKQFIIPRKNEIHVAYQTIDGHVTSESFIGAYAEVVQQMIEMLDGITLFDYGLDLDDIGGIEAFDNATEEEKIEVLSMYMESLKNDSVELKEEIDKDPTLNALNKAIDFNTGVLLGTITPIKAEENKSEELASKVTVEEIK